MPRKAFTYLLVISALVVCAAMFAVWQFSLLRPLMGLFEPRHQNQTVESIGAEGEGAQNESTDQGGDGEDDGVIDGDGENDEEVDEDAVMDDSSGSNDLNGGDNDGADARLVVATNAFVTHVVDGDTLDVRLDDGGEARIRLLGVNTPETVDPRKPVECFGKDASAFTKSRLQGERVRLDSDPLADERDKYGRLLRNVVLEDGTDFNALLVSSGYAYAYTSFPLTPLRKRQIIALQKEAKDAGRGLWSNGACEE